MNKNYFHYLPEAGRIVRSKADDLMYEEARVERLENELKEMKRQISKKYEELERYIASDWNDEEISSAKQTWKEANLKGETKIA